VIEGKLEGRIEMTGNEEEDVSSNWMTLRGKKKILEIKKGSTRSHTLENSLWKRL
jgi:hypothetical protein